MLRAMLRKAFKTLACVIGGLVGLVAAIYIAALVVNWRDQPPSAVALNLAASYETRPSLSDSHNAFVYLLGFDAPLGDDPRVVGARRLAWLKSTNDLSFNEADDPQTTHLEYSSTDPVVEQFLMACESDTRACALAFTNSAVVFEAWNATHPWLLDRYLTLIAHSGWREEVFFLSAPLASYAPALRGQRLLLLHAKVLADAGDTRAARDLLASDARFWRLVLASSDLLITQMIATAALRQHFAWGSLVMRSFPPGSIEADVPDEWRQPLTEAELSLRRVLVGEWMFFANIPAMEYASLRLENSLAGRAQDRLLQPLFQRQATLNRHAAYLDELASTVDAPLREYASAVDRASLLAQRTADEAFRAHWLYNLVGSLLMAAAPADYGGYVGRVGDIEGMRRGALAAVLLRQYATPQLAEALAASPLRNPYDEQPLRWDAEERAVVFVGLEPGERGEHRFYY